MEIFKDRSLEGRAPLEITHRSRRREAVVLGHALTTTGGPGAVRAVREDSLIWIFSKMNFSVLRGPDGAGPSSAAIMFRGHQRR